METLLVIDDYLFGQEYLKTAAKMGLNTVLVSESEPKRKIADFVDQHVQADLSDIDDIAKKIRGLQGKNGISGIVPGHVYHVGLVSALAQELKLPGTSPSAVEVCTNKHYFRNKLNQMASHHLPFFEVDLNSLNKVIPDIIFPCVVKPVDGFASIGIKKVENVSELKTALNIVLSGISYGSKQKSGQKSFKSKAIIEAYLDGPEYSAETFTMNGRTEIIGITKKHFDENANMFESGFELPAMLPEDTIQQIEEHVLTAHRAIGFNHGLTHTEFRLTDNGPRIIEMNPRLGGAHLAELYREASGVDLYELGILNALGKRPKEKFPLRIQNPAVTGWLLGTKGVVVSLDNLPVSTRGNGIRKIICRKQIGDAVLGEGDNRDRILAMVAVGETIDLAHDSIRSALKNIHVQYEV